VSHRAAIKTLLAACTIGGYPGGQVIDPPTFPYWVLFMDTGSDDQEKLCGTSNKTTFRWQVTSVGETDDAAEIVASKTSALLVDVRPVVAGWSPGLIRRVMSIPVRADKDVFLPGSNLHPMYAVDSYELVSRKD
jgi:hypothetical protein